MQLYKITEAMMDTLDIFLDSDQDEVDQEFYSETMNYLKEELNHKSSNIIKYLSNLDAEALAIKYEIDRLTKAKKSRERKSASLKSYLVNTMQVLKKTKIETDLGTFGLRKSTALDIYDMDKIPEEYLKVKKEISVDKREVTNHIKAGEVIEGAALVERYTLNIK
jgi:hypothetical protein